MSEMIHWEFPLPRTHTGILLGNARLGAMIWGEGRNLRVTLGRADLWDHRGGMPWTEKQNFADIRRCLESGDEPALRALFVTATENTPGQPRRPSVIPVGRVDLDLGEGAVLKTGFLRLSDGCVEVSYEVNGAPRRLVFRMAMDRDILLLHAEGGMLPAVINRPAWETLNGELQKISFQPPTLINDGTLGGWVQPLPSDPALCVLHRRAGGMLWIATGRGETTQTARNTTAALLDNAVAAGAAALTENVTQWWAQWWRGCPELELPNESLQHLYQYGMYKFAGLTNPLGVAATLQGPWIEDYQLPPWSSDYHFNINVQMCYWPAFRGNHLENLKPLFDLIFSWEEHLKDNARKFAGVKDGRMLPHAVDDHCTCMGGFWTGSIDHGCTAWVAQMMYDYAVFKPDPVFLRERAFPFMRGTLDVFAAMLEKKDGKYALPVSVSPEYGGAEMKAWGANASFQLAAIHRLCENLQNAAALIGEQPAPLWQDIRENLPAASLRHGTTGVWQPPFAPEPKPEDQRIGLWDGRDLEESHRHHSHLAGLYPFDTLDLNDPLWKKVIHNSIRHWIYQGMGLWTGWCMPWAAILHARLGNGRMSELIIEIWQRAFTNCGHGTLHDPDFGGLSLCRSAMIGPSTRPEIMQMDAGMGVTGAILEMLVHMQRGVLYVLHGVPETWRRCRIRGVRAEGGVLVDAVREDFATREVTLRAQATTTLRLANPFAGAECRISRSDKETRSSDAILELNLQAGETVTLTHA